MFEAKPFLFQEPNNQLNPAGGSQPDTGRGTF